MRIYDEDREQRTSHITLFLTLAEAGELVDALNALLHQNDASWHEHVSDSHFRRDITLAQFRVDRLDLLLEKYHMLLLEET